MLSFDHKEILEKAIKTLKEKIFATDIMKKLYPNTFTLPELQTTYEKVLNRKLDRRNFRKKMLLSKIIEETDMTIKNEKTKPTKLYRFTNIDNKFKF